MPQFINRAGQRFGKLLVLDEWERRPTGKKQTLLIFWKCKCDCGNTVFINAGNLARGGAKSCGCWKYGRKGNQSNRYKHGMVGSPEYLTWIHMKQRCYDPNIPLYARWGGRGIQVCDRWLHSFENFLDDMGLKPTPKYSIDRIDNDGDYNPENCRWATRKQQTRNTPRNRYLTLNGETLCVADWAEQTGIASRTIRQRIDYCGWSVEKALTTPVHHRSTPP